MKRLRSLFVTMLGIGLTLGLMAGCQQLPTAPQLSTEQSAHLQAVPVNPDYIGLAKTAQSDTTFITVQDGGTLGGYYQTDNNVIVLPSNTLTEDLYLTFSLVYVDDPADSLYGALSFSVTSFQTSAGDGASNHVQFQSGATASLYVNKTWLDGVPNAVVNLETGEIVTGVVDAGEYWKINVPHFSDWAWVWTL